MITGVLLLAAVLSLVPAEAAPPGDHEVRPWLSVTLNWVLGKISIMNQGGNYITSIRHVFLMGGCLDVIINLVGN